MLTTAVAMATAMATAESVACWPGSAAIIIADVVAAMIVVATAAAIVAVTVVAEATTVAAAIAAAKSCAANCLTAPFAAAFGFRLAKPKKLLARVAVANKFANKFPILAAERFAYLAPSKFSAA